MQIPTPVNDTNVSFAKPIQALSKARRVSRTRRNLKSRRRPAANQTRAAQDRNRMINKLPRIATVWLAIAIGLALSASFFVGLAAPALAQQSDKGGEDQSGPRYCSPLPAPSNVTATAGNAQINVSWSTLSAADGYDVVFGLTTSETQRFSSFSSTVTSANITHATITNGNSYSVQVRAYEYPSGSDLQDCEGTLSTAVTVVMPPNPPTNLSVTVESNDDNDLDVTFTRSGSVHYYQIELHRSLTEYGTYSKVSTANVTTSRADFDNQARDYWYKARARNCKSFSRTVCGGWSPLTDAVQIPPAPTTTITTPAAPSNLNISVEPDDDNDLDVTFTRTGTVHFYQIELHRSSTQDGTYSKVTTGNVTTSPADFDNQAREYWYKARGKNRSTSARISCSGWSWSNAVRVPPVSTTTPPPTVTPTTPDPPSRSGRNPRCEFRIDRIGFLHPEQRVDTLLPDRASQRRHRERDLLVAGDV